MVYNFFGDKMETTLYIVRHCEAQGNLKRIFQGLTDLDITEAGEKQLEKLSQRFSDIEIDAVYSSPLLRAQKTALAIANPKGLNVTEDHGLIELNGGVIEGMSFADIFTNYPKIEDDWLNNPQNFCAPKGESMRQVYERIWLTVQKIAKENKGKTVAVATHGGAIRNLICRITKGSIEKLNEVGWSENTAVSKLVFDNNFNVKAEFINDISHLPSGFISVAAMMEVE